MRELVYLVRERTELSRPDSIKQWPDVTMIKDDAYAHCWEVEVYQNGQAYDLSGCSVKGWFTRKDGVTVPVDGMVEGHTVRVELDPACYAVHGDLVALLRASVGDTIITLARARFYVCRGVSDKISDATGVVPSLVALLALFEKLKAYDDVKLDANLGAANAGKLLYVSATGAVLPLSIGGGLEIKNGVLSVTGASGSGSGGTDTSQTFYTADGSVFHTIDDAVFYVTGG